MKDFHLTWTYRNSFILLCQLCLSIFSFYLFFIFNIYIFLIFNVTIVNVTLQLKKAQNQRFAPFLISVFYPSATSNIIIIKKPAITPIVPRLECSP